MDTKEYCVYMHINKLNNKKYIGITRQNPKTRWANGQGYRTQPFYKAIEKYTWNGFEHKILYEGLDYKQACDYEIELIKKYNTTNPQFGYNISDGGEDVIKYYNHLVHTNKTVYQYSFSGKFIQSFESVASAVKYLGLDNENADTNISACARGKDHHRSAYGYIWSYEYLGEQIDEYNQHDALGEHNRVKVYQYELNGAYCSEFDSITVASEKYNVSTTSISEALDLPYRQSCGYQWRTYLQINGIEPYTINPERNNNLKKKIVSVDKEDLSIFIYNGLSDAKEKLNLIDTSAISDVLTKNKPSAYGYFWFYYEEYESGIWKDYISFYGMQRTVYVYDNHFNEKIYKNLKELCDKSVEDFGCSFSKSEVCEVCNNKKALYKNYTFSYVRLNKNEIQKRYTPKEKKTTAKKVYVYDIDLNYICTYKSLSYLTENSEKDFDEKFSSGCISRVCLGQRKQYKGYIFSYTPLESRIQNDSLLLCSNL